MAFSDYSTTAASNTSIGGLNIAEDNTAPSTVNNAIRQIMADGRALYDTVNAIDVSTYMPKAGGAFTGSITRSGAGSYWYHANSAQSGGAVYTYPTGTALPSSPAEGTVVFFY